jgi:hypothetical protein
MSVTNKDNMPVTNKYNKPVTNKSVTNNFSNISM